MSKLNICFWNVHGLNNGKLNDPDFVSYIDSFDVIGFVEMLKSESPGGLQGFSTPFVVKPTRRKRSGRPSGGIAIYIKPHDRNGIKEVHRSNFTIWLKLDKSLLGLSSNIFLWFFFCIKPYENKDKSELIFSELQNEALKFNKKCEVLICGDFNARTRGLQDFILNDDVKENFVDCPLPNDYISDVSINRHQLDEISNLHGNLLVKLCKDLQMRILKGRFLGDSLGFFTFFVDSNGQSTVDYMLSTTSMFYYVQYCNVKPPVECSDHSLLSVCFSISTQRETTHMLNNDFGKFLWEEQKADLYQDTLLQNEHLDQIMNAIEKVDDENFMDIDSIVGNINSIYKKAALQTLKFKKKGNHPSNRPRKARPKKPWMSYDCLRLRTEVRFIGKRLQREQNNPFLRQTFSICKREYDMLKKKLKSNFLKSFMNKINDFDQKDSKSFW
jgi:hypothetical protein